MAAVQTKLAVAEAAMAPRLQVELAQCMSDLAAVTAQLELCRSEHLAEQEAAAAVHRAECEAYRQQATELVARLQDIAKRKNAMRARWKRSVLKVANSGVAIGALKRQLTNATCPKAAGGRPMTSIEAAPNEKAKQQKLRNYHKACNMSTLDLARKHMVGEKNAVQFDWRGGS